MEKIRKLWQSRGPVDLQNGAELYLHRFDNILPKTKNLSRAWKFSRYGNQAEAFTLVVSKTIMLTGFEFGAPVMEGGKLHCNYLMITKGDRTGS